MVIFRVLLNKIDQRNKKRVREVEKIIGEKNPQNQSVKNKILKCQTELPLLFAITFDSMNTYFSGAFQQNMFSILEAWVAAYNRV